MHTLTAWMLTVVVVLAPLPGIGGPDRIEVDCGDPGALDRALVRAQKATTRVDIVLLGICTGNYAITSGDVTLRAAMPGSGLAAPQDDPGVDPVLDVTGARATLRGTLVRGGVVGVRVSGWDAEVLLVDADVHEQGEIGLFAERGATLRLIDTIVRDGNVGVAVQSDSTANLQRARLSGFDAAMIVAEESFAALNDTIVEHNRTGGLNVIGRSDVNVFGGAFRDNGQVHANANDWSGIALAGGVELGAPGDPTWYAFGAARNARVSCSTTPDVYGDVSAIDGASVRLFGTVLHGDLDVRVFANATASQSEITGVVACVDGSEVICRNTTSAGVFGCPSTSCGPPLAAAPAPGRAGPDLPTIRLPRVPRDAESGFEVEIRRH